jgi:hypothetical protein
MILQSKNTRIDEINTLENSILTELQTFELNTTPEYLTPAPTTTEPTITTAPTTTEPTITPPILTPQLGGKSKKRWQTKKHKVKSSKLETLRKNSKSNRR